MQWCNECSQASVISLLTHPYWDVPTSIRKPSQWFVSGRMQTGLIHWFGSFCPEPFVLSRQPRTWLQHVEKLSHLSCEMTGPIVFSWRGLFLEPLLLPVCCKLELKAWLMVTRFCCGGCKSCPQQAGRCSCSKGSLRPSLWEKQLWSPSGPSLSSGHRLSFHWV